MTRKISLLKALKQWRDAIYLLRIIHFQLQCSKEDLEKMYGKKIILADRDLVENKAEETILKHAKDSDAALLVIGDLLEQQLMQIFSWGQKKQGYLFTLSTTHRYSMRRDNRPWAVQVRQDHFNPIREWKSESPLRRACQHLEKGLHTLFCWT